jgi:PAS domain-containing protein
MTKDIIDRSHATEARSLAEDIVDTVREPLLVLHEDLRVQSANRAFYDAFGGRARGGRGLHGLHPVFPGEAAAIGREPLVVDLG